MNNLNWGLLTLYVFLGFGLIRFLEKKIVGLPSRTHRLFLMFSFNFTWAFTAWALFDREFSLGMLVVFLVGVSNGVSIFFRWKATAISLSGTSVWSFMDDVIAMGLAFIILREDKLLNPLLAVGVTIAIVSVVYLGFQKTGTDWPARFFLYIGISSVLWGVAYFSHRFFAFGGLSPGKYLLAWYSGSFLSTLLIKLWWKEEETAGQAIKVSAKGVGVMFLMSLCAFGSMVIAVTILRTMPQIVFQPVLLVGEAVIPTLMGLYIFKEHKDYTPREKILLGSAVLGVIVIAFGI
jgi:hypothetical protein